jgi:hypothetical protein
MSPDWVQAIAELAGTVLVPFAVYFAALQWRISARQYEQLRLVMLSDIQQGLADQFQQLVMIMIEHPELRKYFYAGVEPPSCGPESDQAQVLAGMFMDFVDTTVVHKDHMPPAYFEEWKNYFVDLYRASPLLRRMADEWAAFYGPEVAQIFATARALEPRDCLGAEHAPPGPAESMADVRRLPRHRAGNRRPDAPEPSGGHRTREPGSDGFRHPDPAS